MTMTPFCPSPTELELQARALQEEHNEVAADDRAGMIEAFIRKEIPTTWLNEVNL